MGEAFLHGFVLAFGLILPIGVQNGFIITQGSVHRRLSGALPTIITASICDTLLIVVSIFGVTFIAWTSPWVRLVMGIIGCGFLLFMGWSIFTSAAATPVTTTRIVSEPPDGEIRCTVNSGVDQDEVSNVHPTMGQHASLQVKREVRQEEDQDGDPSKPWHPRRQILTAASTSLLNPHAWMDTLAIIGGSAIVYPTWNLRASFGVACVLVSWLWFFLLAVVGHIAGTKLLSGGRGVWLNRGSAIMMWAAAVYLAIVLIRG